MAQRVVGLTGATLEHAPSVCQTCVWWQSRAGRTVAKDRWIEKTEDDWGAWGALYRDDNGRLLGSIQYGHTQLFPRAAELPAGPPSEDAVLVTCVYVVSSATPWVEQSLFLAAIGEARDKGAKALEAFAYRYPEGESTYERFLVHRTVFPRDFLADFGFRFGPRSGRVELRGSSSAGSCRSPRASGRPCCASSRRRSRRRPSRSGPDSAFPRHGKTRSLARFGSLRGKQPSTSRHHAVDPRALVGAAIAVAVAIVGGATPRRHATPAGFTDTLVATVESPTALAFTPDGRLLVATQFGGLRVVETGALLAAPALDLGGVPVPLTSEGLLGLAVDPSFASNGFVYPYYTRNKSGSCVNRVSRFTMSGSTIAIGERVGACRRDPVAERQPQRRRSPVRQRRLSLRQRRRRRLRLRGRQRLRRAERRGPRPACAGRQDPADHQQRRRSRRRTRSRAPVRRGATSPAGRPPGTSARRPSRGDCGIRSASPSTPTRRATRFFINDVGQDAWEEIDLGVRRARTTAGTSARAPAPTARLTNCGAPPAGHDEPDLRLQPRRSGCPRSPAAPSCRTGSGRPPYDGAYLFGDYTCGKIFTLTPNGGGGFTRSEFTDDVGAVVNMTFGPSPQGQGLYYTNYRAAARCA